MRVRVPYWDSSNLLARSHPLPVFGLVYVPSLKTAYWVNVKRYLKANPTATIVRFPATEANKFDSGTFNKLFQPVVVGGTPQLEIDEAFRLTRSKKAAETYLGLLVLFRRYPNNTSVWQELVRTFQIRPKEEIPPVLLYWLAHIPGHGDIFYFGETLTRHTRAFAANLFTHFDLRDVVKLLSFIDSEEQIGRGTLGQSIEAIVFCLPESRNMLREIGRSSVFEMPLRESAALILAMNEGKEALPDLAELEAGGSWYAGEIIKHVKEYGSINPYA